MMCTADAYAHQTSDKKAASIIPQISPVVVTPSNWTVTLLSQTGLGKMDYEGRVVWSWIWPVIVTESRCKLNTGWRPLLAAMVRGPVKLHSRYGIFTRIPRGELEQRSNRIIPRKRWLRYACYGGVWGNCALTKLQCRLHYCDYFNENLKWNNMWSKFVLWWKLIVHQSHVNFVKSHIWWHECFIFGAPPPICTWQQKRNLIILAATIHAELR